MHASVWTRCIGFFRCIGNRLEALEVLADASESADAEKNRIGWSLDIAEIYVGRRSERPTVANDGGRTGIENQ